MSEEFKFKVGEMAYLDNRRATRALVLAPPRNGRCPVLLETGTVGNYLVSALMTLPDWIKWWTCFKPEVTGREFDDAITNASKEFVPPPFWHEAVRRASEPYQLTVNQSAIHDELNNARRRRTVRVKSVLP